METRYKMETTPLQKEKYAAEGTSQKLTTENIRQKDTTFLLIIVATGSILHAMIGILVTWSSSAIPKLKSNITEENPLERPITTFEMSMLAGLPILTMSIGSMVHGYLSDVIGRKRTMQIIGVGTCISIILLALSTNIYSIIVFRCFGGYFANGGWSLFLIYLTEICEDHNRAKYGCFANAYLPMGNLIILVFGAFLNFKYFTLAELLPMMIFFVFFFLAPESPVYSLSKNKTDECMKTLKKLRSNKNEQELITDFHKINDIILTSKMHTKYSRVFLNLFTTKESRYALFLASFPVIMKIFCGLGITVPFMEPIFIAAGTKYDNRYMPIVASAFKMFGFFVTSYIVEKLGRKILLLISMVGSGVSLFALGCFFYLKTIDSSLIDYLQWFPLACMIIYVLFFSGGVGGIPMGTMGEMFTPDLRAAGTSFILGLFTVCLFISSATYPYIDKYLGLHWCMWIYSFLSISGTCIVYVILPENKGKSILEIQEYVKLRCSK